MFFRKKHKLDPVIDDVINSMSNYPVGSEEYGRQLERLTSLYEVKEHETRSPMSLDTLLVVVGNVAGIAAIVKYEEMNVFASRAANFVLKPKAG